MVKPLEKDIQNAVCAYLDIKKYFFWRNNNVPISEMRGGQRVFRAMPKYARKGVPDIIVVKDGGRVVFLEIKRPGGIQSVWQVSFQEDCRHVGAEYHIITSLEQAMKIL